MYLAVGLFWYRLNEIQAIYSISKSICIPLKHCCCLLSEGYTCTKFRLKTGFEKNTLVQNHWWCQDLMPRPVHSSELINYGFKSARAGHVSAESIVMAFKQESHCLHKSSGSEEEEVWLHAFLLHQHAPPSKKKASHGARLINRL